MDLSLDRLEVFVKIVETGSMTAAARALHVTQPALSRSLKLLEQTLEVALFRREGRGLVVTAAGRALLPRAKSLLASATGLSDAVARVAARGYFDVRIGTVDSVATYLLPRVVETLFERFPELEIKLFTARTGDLLARLRDDDLDLAVVAWSGPPAVHRHRAVGPYDLQFYGRIDRFPDLGDAVTEEAVRAYPIVEIEATTGQPTMIPDAAPSFAVSGSLASVKAMVLAGFGVGALLSFMLTPAEAARLARAAVPHDPDCQVFVLPSAAWEGARERAIEDTLVDALRRALSAPSTPSGARDDA